MKFFLRNLIHCGEVYIFTSFRYIASFFNTEDSGRGAEFSVANLRIFVEFFYSIRIQVGKDVSDSIYVSGLCLYDSSV